MIKAEKVIIETFSKEQVEALLHQPNLKTFTGLRAYTLMLLLLETGIRISECVKIDLTDVNMKEGQIRIHGKVRNSAWCLFKANFAACCKSI